LQLFVPKEWKIDPLGKGFSGKLGRLLTHGDRLSTISLSLFGILLVLRENAAQIITAIADLHLPLDRQPAREASRLVFWRSDNL